MGDVTNRLAITDLNTEAVPLDHIFKIFERVSDGKVNAVRQYVSSKTGNVFTVAEFDTRETAKYVYNFCDQSEIENTHQVFNLSFIPDTANLTNPISECLDSSGFVSHSSKKKEEVGELEVSGDPEEMIQFSGEDESESNLAGEDAPESETEQKADKRLKKNEKEEENGLKAAIAAERPVNELEGYEFDLSDPRLERLYTDNDFILDASSPLFAAQKESSLIVEERRRRRK